MQPEDLTYINKHDSSLDMMREYICKDINTGKKIYHIKKRIDNDFILCMAHISTMNKILNKPFCYN